MATYLSATTIAKRLGVAHGKILAWIHSGELHAVDVSTHAAERPQWRIREDDLETFLRVRSRRRHAVAT